MWKYFQIFFYVLYRLMRTKQCEQCDTCSWCTLAQRSHWGETVGITVHQWSSRLSYRARGSQPAGCLTWRTVIPSVERQWSRCASVH